MHITVEQVGMRSTAQNPFTHRLEFHRCTYEQFDSIAEWVREMDIVAWRGYVNCSYWVKPDDVSLFLLRWS